MGLIFYATHFPERVVPRRWARLFSWIGGGSHAIWHMCIVLAISLHRSGLGLMTHGINGGSCFAVS